MRKNTRAGLIFVLILILCIGAISLIGCGDDDGDDPKGYVRIHNGITCSDGTSFQLQGSFNGVENNDDKDLFANSGEWSACTEFAPDHYVVLIWVNGCGYARNIHHSFVLAEDCTYEYRVFLENGQVVSRLTQACPGNC